jgi:hypothetical protein
MALYPWQFRPNAPNDLIRIGSQYDGGYVIPERVIGATRGLLSFGLNDEWQFEVEFSRRSQSPVVCFDPTVTGLFWLRKLVAGVLKGSVNLDATRLRRGFRYIDYIRFFDGRPHRHIQEWIGNRTGAVTVTQAIERAQLAEPLFLKMDIEGAEYRVLDEVVIARSKFSGMAIEFHDADLHEGRIIDFVERIKDCFVLVHMHANSHTAVGPGGAALVLEFSFLNRSLLLKDEVLQYRPLPIAGLDAPNLPGDHEALVNFREMA